MFLKSLAHRVVSKFAQPILNANNIQLDNPSFINSNSSISRATLRGKISLQEGCLIRGGVKIDARAPINIGRYTSLNGPATEICSAINKIEIGSFCSIARQVSIQEYNHRYESLSSYHIFKNIFKEDVSKDINSKGDIRIGNDVWIGSNVSILSGVNIGHGAIIAANSVVTNDVSDYSIVGGIPAKIIKMRFNQPIIDRLLQIKWWDWSIEKIKENRYLFEEPLSLEGLDKVK